MPNTNEIYPLSMKTSQVAAGDETWQSMNLSANDGNAANVTATTFDLSVFTQRLKAKGFVFPAGLSAGATIQGVKLHMEVWGTASIIATSVNLLGTDGAISGTNKSVGTSAGFSATTQIMSAGAANDLWGCALTPAIVGTSQFGVGIRCKALANNSDIWIDYVTLDIFYDNNMTNVKFVSF